MPTGPLQFGAGCGPETPAAVAQGTLKGTARTADAVSVAVVPRSCTFAAFLGPGGDLSEGIAVFRSIGRSTVDLKSDLATIQRLRKCRLGRLLGWIAVGCILLEVA